MDIEILLTHKKLLEDKILILQNELKDTKEHLEKYGVPHHSQNSEVAEKY